MSESIIPLSSYNLKVVPGVPTLAIDEDFPVSVKLTMVAIDPTSAESHEPTTLKILKRPSEFPSDGIYMDDSEEEEEESEESSEEEEKPKKKKGSKKDEDSDEEMEEGDSEDEDDDTFEIEEYIICTLSPKTAFQQPIDLTITADEEVLFEVVGPHTIHLTGNYIEHPYDGESEDDYDSEDLEASEDELDSEDYDLSPDEDEVIAGRLEVLPSDEEEEEVEAPKPKKKAEEKKAKETKESKKKRAAEEEEAPKKKQKKTEDKKVAFSKELEQGPTPTSKKPATRKLEGGVTIEDRTVGDGPVAKKGSKVGVRYVGKLANGKVFDSNTKGKPFYFNLGKGEVIKGWDVGVAGMAVKGERRIVIPAPMAYGKQKLPGIPPNSELTFDVKLVNIK
ncbi:peptidyl-prolyl cis-trans isomerase [Trichomonascus vanleenenianus]|uniref:FKBP-type peptidyl-prolyl cis-trans isomerase n=1 Tax=Trichomonascus vanleenenianus TaxID=2268995 RepID=UPI003EC980D4